MKVVSSITFFHDAVGTRASITYSEISEQGKVLADNKRVDVVVVGTAAKADAEKCLAWAQEAVANIEG